MAYRSPYHCQQKAHDVVDRLDTVLCHSLYTVRELGTLYAHFSEFAHFPLHGLLDAVNAGATNHEMIARTLKREPLP